MHVMYLLQCRALRCWPQAPSGLLPAMELNGRFVTESDAIMALLEQTFPDNNPLLPPRGSDSAQVGSTTPRANSHC